MTMYKQFTTTLKDLPPSLTFLDATLITSVAMAFGACLSRDVATTGN